MANTPDQAPIAEMEYEPSAFELAFAKHKSKFILVTLLTGVGALGFYSMKFWKEHRDTQDGLALYKAETVADYERVAKELSGRNAGGNALLLAAQIHADENKPEEARSKLEAFLKDYGNHPLADLATLRLAETQFLTGKVEEAKASLTAVFEKFPQSAHAPLALMRLADQLAVEKNVDEARKKYELLKEKYAGCSYWDAAMKHRDALTRKDPTPVDFVPDAPPAPPTPGGANLGAAPEAPSTILDIPALNPTAPAIPVEPNTTLDVPKLDAPAAPAPAAEAPADAQK